MSDAVVADIVDMARGAALKAAWAQWSALTSMAVPAGQQAQSIVDPEALVLASLALRQEEPRLVDLLAGLAKRDAALLSVQRMKSLSAAYPEGVSSALGGFAGWAVAAGDPRWTKYVAPTGPSAAPRPGKVFGELRLLDGPALVLRLRAAFGVGAKADLLAFLLGLHDDAASLQAAAMTTGYSQRALRTVVDDMGRAGLVERLRGASPTFYARHGPWAHVLAAHRREMDIPLAAVIPPWRYWSAIFVFLANIVHWGEQAAASGWNAYIASSRARDMVERHHVALQHPRLPLPAPHLSRGAEYLREFQASMIAIAAWLEENV